MTMQNLTMAGNTLMQMQAMQSASTKLQGRANVLKSELKHVFCACSVDGAGTEDQ